MLQQLNNVVDERLNCLMQAMVDQAWHVVLKQPTDSDIPASIWNATDPSIWVSPIPPEDST